MDLVGDILSVGHICSTVLAASGPEGVRTVLGLCREARYRAVTYTVRVPLPIVSKLLVHALLHWPVQQTVLLFGWALLNHACAHVVHIQLRFSGSRASAVSKNVLSAIADHISDAAMPESGRGGLSGSSTAGLKHATCAADDSASTSWTLDIELRAAGERERVAAESKLAALLASPERASMHVRQAIPTFAEAAESLHVNRQPRIWGYAKSVAPLDAMPPTAPRIHYASTLGKLSIAPTAEAPDEHLEILETLLCYPEKLRALCVHCWRPTLFEAQRMQAAADACMRTLIDLVRGAVMSGATPAPPPTTTTTTARKSTFWLALDAVLRMGGHLRLGADDSDHYTARLGRFVKTRTALAAALHASVLACDGEEGPAEYASQMRAVLDEFLGALPALVGAHGLPTYGPWACGPMLTWIALCAGQCAIRQYVARLMHREEEENGAESNPGGGASSARGNPLLIEEAALSQMLSLSAPDAEVRCFRDCLWAPLPASASRSRLLAAHLLSWPARPEQPAPPALQMRQVLSREGLPALYDLYAGSCRLLAQRPLPLITELPPPLDAYSLRAALHVAQRRRVTASRRDLATGLTCSRPTDLTVCPRCGCSPTGCAAAHPESVANIRHQLHVVMKQSITQGESILGVRAFPASEESLLAWRCAVRGPADSPWAGKAVPFLLRFCGPWPNAPPLLVALPPIPFHPNFDSSTGAVCMDLLQEHWSPAAGVLGVLLSAQSLLTSPTVADANSLPANVEAAHQLLRKPAAYHSCNQRLAASLQPW